MLSDQLVREKSVSTTIIFASGANPLFVPLALPLLTAIPATVDPCAVPVSRLVHIPASISALSQTQPKPYSAGMFGPFTVWSQYRKTRVLPSGFLKSGWLKSIPWSTIPTMTPLPV